VDYDRVGGKEMIMTGARRSTHEEVTRIVCGMTCILIETQTAMQL
jgi:hypothetical protein